MSFAAHYDQHLRRVERLAQDIIEHAPDPGSSTNAYLADLAGLLTTAYVGAFECAVKAILIGFAASNGKILETMASYHFEKLNSKIGRDDLLAYTRQFGEIYEHAFKAMINELEREILNAENSSLKHTYANLLMWRHTFVHAGEQLATLDEVAKAYPIAKRVILALDRAMSVPPSDDACPQQSTQQP